MQRPLLEEHVRLVNEDDCLPSSGDVEDPVESRIESCSTRAQIATANHVQRPLHVLRSGLGREGLANTRRAEQVDDETVSFSFNEVIESELLVVCFDKRLKEVFAVIREDEV